MSKKIIIAIDGYSSTGKSTIAKELAKKLKYTYVDTGAMYRAVALFALQNKFISDSFFEVKKLIQNLEKIKIQFNKKNGSVETYLNSVNVEEEIRSLKVSSHVSKIASVKPIRKKLIEAQREMGKNKGLVIDGRDIGTVVFPKAELKFFIKASLRIRTKRRYNELKGKYKNVNYKAILDNLNLRDHEDTTRINSTLVKAKDAIEIDNSNMTIEKQFNLIYQSALKVLK